MLIAENQSFQFKVDLVT